METEKDKIDPLHAASTRVIEIAIVADRKGCAETGQLMLDLMDFLAAKIALPPDYREPAHEDRLPNENLQ